MIENIIKILEIPEVTGLVIVTFAASLKLSKKYFDSLLDERSKTLKWFTEQIESIDEIEPYRLEQIFSERYKQVLPYKEIKFFLATDSPSENLHYYINAKNYFVFNDMKTEVKLYKERKYITLRVLRNLYSAGYYLGSLFALMLIYVLPKLYGTNSTSFISAYFIIIMGLFFAAACINSQHKVECAERLKLNSKYF